MRQIGTVADPQNANRLADYLLTLGIRSRIEASDTGAAVWIYDEDQRERATGELAQFNANPADPRYEAAARQARQIEQQAQAEEKRYRKNVVELRERWSQNSISRRPLTFALVAISALVAVGSHFGNDPYNEPLLRWLWITPPVVADGEVIDFHGLSATLHGQWWRLITPIFIHFGVMHLLFNAFATIDLGSQVEMLRGTWRMLLLVLVLALVSNLAQFFESGPAFGGLSGVGYGLFGYVWMKSRYEPRSGFFMHPNTVVVMLAWFVYCYSPWAIALVANTAHAAGLGLGIACGIAPLLARKLFG